jgi:hypothetical protein
VHGDEGPVGDNTCDADAAIGVFTSDQVFDGGSVELRGGLVWMRPH